MSIYLCTEDLIIQYKKPDASFRRINSFPSLIWLLKCLFKMGEFDTSKPDIITVELQFLLEEEWKQGFFH